MLWQKLKENRRDIFWSIVTMAVIAGLYWFSRRYLELFKDPEELRVFLLEQGKYSVGVFLLLQVTQVVVFVIPAEITQISGGFVFGTFFGTVLCLLGSVIGCTVLFYMARLNGKKALDRFIGKKDSAFVQRVINLGNSKRAMILIHLLPGTPKDVLGLVYGVTDMKYKDYIVYSSLARIPYVLFSSFIGARLIGGNYLVPIILSILLLIIILIGVLKAEKLWSFLLGGKAS